MVHPNTGESQGALQDFVYKEGNGIRKMLMKVFKDEKGYKTLRSGSGYDKWYPGSPLPNWSGRQGGSDSSPPPVPWSGENAVVIFVFVDTNYCCLLLFM